MSNELKHNWNFECLHPLSKEIIEFLKLKQPLTYDDLLAISYDIKQLAKYKVHDEVIAL